MPNIEVPGFGVVAFPDDMSETDITAAIRKNMIPETRSGGIGDMARGFVRSASRAVDEAEGSLFSAVEGTGAATGIGSLEAFGRRGRERNAAEAEASMPAAERQSFAEANSLGDYVRATGQTIAGSLPGSALGLGGAAAGALAGAPLGPAGIAAGALVGGFAGSFPQFYGQNRIRQIEETGAVQSEGKAALAAIPQAGVESLTDRLTLGLGRVLKLGGDDVARAVIPRIARGIGLGAASEVPAEVLQQALERGQAGLDVLSPEAMAEYKEAAIGAAAAGGTIGGVASGLGGKPADQPGADQAARDRELLGALQALRTPGALETASEEDIRASARASMLPGWKDGPVEDLRQRLAQLLAGFDPSAGERQTPEQTDLVKNMERDNRARLAADEAETAMRRNAAKALVGARAETMDLDTLRRITRAGTPGDLATTAPDASGQTPEQAELVRNFERANRDKIRADESETAMRRNAAAALIGPERAEAMTLDQLRRVTRAGTDGDLALTAPQADGQTPPRPEFNETAERTRLTTAIRSLRGSSMTDARLARMTLAELRRMVGMDEETGQPRQTTGQTPGRPDLTADFARQEQEAQRARRAQQPQQTQQPELPQQPQQTPQQTPQVPQQTPQAPEVVETPQVPQQTPQVPEVTTPEVTTPETVETPQQTPQAPARGQRPTTIQTVSGMKIDADYEVVDLSELQHASGRDQPRDRTRASSGEQVSEIVRDFNPDWLMVSPEADRGAPIISPNSVVESGNGRVQALRRVLAESPEKWAAYQAAIKAAGFNTDGVQAPVLVRRRKTELDDDQRAQFVDDANTPTTMTLSDTERGMMDSRLIDGPLLSLLDREADLFSAKNNRFVTAFMSRLPAGQRNSLMDADGSLSQTGARRIESAVLARAYGDPKLLARIVEDTDDNTKMVSRALLEAAPKWIGLRDLAADGTIRPEFDITKSLLGAVSKLRDMRLRKQKFKDFVAQTDPFAIQDPVADVIFESFYDDKTFTAKAAGKVSAYLDRYVDEAEKKTVSNMFPDTSTPLDAVIAVRKEPQGALFSSREAAGITTAPGTVAADAAKAQAVVDKRLAELEAMGRQGKAAAASVRAAMASGQFQPNQLLAAFQIAETAARILGDRNLRLDFLPKIIAGGAERQGEAAALSPDGVEGLLRFSLANDWLGFARQTAAHEAFHVAQMLFAGSAANFRITAALREAFPVGKGLAGIDPTLIRKLRTLRPPGSRGSYWDQLTGDSAITAETRPVELQAYVFGALDDARRNGQPMTGIKPALLRLANFLSDLKSQARTVLLRDGYRTAGRVMDDVSAGRGLTGQTTAVGRDQLDAAYSSRNTPWQPASPDTSSQPQTGTFASEPASRTTPAASGTPMTPSPPSPKSSASPGQTSSPPDAAPSKSGKTGLPLFDAPKPTTGWFDPFKIKSIGGLPLEVVGPVSEGFVSELQVAMASLPREMRQAIQDHGTRIITGLQFSDHDVVLARQRPRGWFSGTWNNADGAYDPSLNAILVFESPIDQYTGRPKRTDRAGGVMRHEAGHAFDRAMGHPSRNDKGFVQAFLRDRKDLAPELRAPGPGNPIQYYVANGAGLEAAASETFAELSAVALGSPRIAGGLNDGGAPASLGASTDVDLSKHMPRTTDWLRQVIRKDKVDAGGQGNLFSSRSRPADLVNDKAMAEAFKVIKGAQLTPPGFLTRTLQKATGALPGESYKDALYRNVINRAAPLYMLDTLKKQAGIVDSYELGRMADGAFNNAGRLEMVLEHGAIGYDPKTDRTYVRDDVPSLIAAFVGPDKKNPRVRDNEVDDFQAYLATLRERDLIKDGRSGFQNLSPAQVYAAIKAAEAKRPAWKDAAADIQKINQAMLEFGVATGILDPVKARDLAKIFYTPFYREAAKEDGDGDRTRGPTVSSSLNDPKAFEKTIHESKDGLGDLFENIVKNYDYILRSGEKNMVLRATAEAMVKVKNERGEPLAEPIKYRKDGDKQVITFKIGGQEKQFKLNNNDPTASAVFLALVGMPAPIRSGIFTAAASIAGVFRTGVTSLPSYMLANLWRGKIVAYAQEGLPLHTNTLNGMRQVLKTSQAMKDFSAETGFGGMSMGMGDRNIAGALSRKLRSEGGDASLWDKARNVVDKLQKASESTEVGDRLKLQQRLVAQGMTVGQAAHQAYLLAPYSRKGMGDGFIGQVLMAGVPLIPFLNSKVQGLARLFEADGPNKKRIAGIPSAIFLRGLTYSAVSMALYGLASDDERWKDETPDRKLMYDIVYTPAGRIYLPRPFEYGTFFGALPQFMLGALRGKEGADDLHKAGVQAMLSTFGFNPIPQAVLPLLETAVNYDFFRMRPIESQGMEQLPVSERVTEQTSTVAKGVSAAFGAVDSVLPQGGQLQVSPIKAQRLIEGYTGSMGTMLMAGFDALLGATGLIPERPGGVFGSPSSPGGAAALVGGVSRFFRGDEEMVSRYVGDFFTAKREADQIAKAVREYALIGQHDRAQELLEENRDKLAARPTLEKVEVMLGNISRQMRVIQADQSMPLDERREELNRLRALRNDLSRRGVEVTREAAR